MIIVDDCSTDQSADIVKLFAENDKRIKLLTLGTNSGPAVARNTAIKAAEGRYIAFLDSDDQWLPDKLDKQLSFMTKNNYSFTYTYYEKMKENGDFTEYLVSPPEKITYIDMLKSNHIGCLTAIYDSHKIGKVYMPNIRKRQDYGLWLSILRKEKYAYCLPENLALYRIRTGSLSSNKLELLKYNWQLFRKIEKLSIAKSIYYLAWNIVRKILT